MNENNSGTMGLGVMKVDQSDPAESDAQTFRTRSQVRRMCMKMELMDIDQSRFI